MVARRRDLVANLAITADPSRLDKGLRRSTRDVARFANSAGNSFKNLGIRSSLALIGINVGLIAVAKNAINAADQIAKSAKALGFQAEEYQKLLFAIERVGGDLTAIERGILRFQKQLAGVGDQEGVRVFERLGLSVERFRSLGPEKAFDAIIDRLALVEDLTERNALTMDLFGTRGSKAINLLVNDLNSYSAELQRSESIGAIFSDGTLENVQITKDAFGDLAAVLTRGFTDGFLKTGIERGEEWNAVMLDLGNAAEFVGRGFNLALIAINGVVKALANLESSPNPLEGTFLFPTLDTEIFDEVIQEYDQLISVLKTLESQRDSYNRGSYRHGRLIKTITRVLGETGPVIDDLTSIYEKNAKAIERINDELSAVSTNSQYTSRQKEKIDALTEENRQIELRIGNQKLYTIEINKTNDGVDFYLEQLQRQWKQQTLVNEALFVSQILEKARVKGITDIEGRVAAAASAHYRLTHSVEGFIDARKRELEIGKFIGEARRIEEGLRKAENAGIHLSIRGRKELSKYYSGKYLNDFNDYVEALKESHRVQDLSGRAAFVNIAVTKAVNAGYADQLDLIREIAGARYDDLKVQRLAREALEARIKAEENALEELRENLKRHADQMQKIWDNMIQGMQRSFTEVIHNTLWEDGISSFKDFGNTILDIWKRTISEMVAAWATSGMARLLAGGGFGGFGLAGSGIASAAGSVASSGIGGIGGFGSALGSFGRVAGPAAPGIAGTGFLGGAGAAFGGGFGNFFNVGANAAAAGGGLGATLGAALPVLGAIALAVSFFSSKTKLLDEGLRVTINQTDTLVESFRRVQKSRFWGLSKRTRTTYDSVSDTLQQLFADSVDTIRETAGGVLEGFGFISDGVDDFTDEIKLSLKGLSEDERTEAIEQAITDLTIRMSQAAFAANGMALDLEATERAMILLGEAGQLVVAAAERAHLINEGQFDTLGAFTGQIANLTTQQLFDILEEVRSELETAATHEVETLTNLNDAIEAEFSTRGQQRLESGIITRILEAVNVTVSGINDLAEAAQNATMTALQFIRDNLLPLGTEAANAVADVLDRLFKAINERVEQFTSPLVPIGNRPSVDIADEVRSILATLIDFNGELGTVGEAAIEALRATERARAEAERPPRPPRRDESNSGGEGPPGFATGGIVPGSRGMPVLAVVHGGEEILTLAQRRRNDSGDRPMIININIEGDADSRVVRAIERRVRDVASIIATA